MKMADKRDLYSHFHEEGRKKLQTDLKIANLMAVPKLTKIVINVGLGEALTDRKVLEVMSEQLIRITGQKPIVTRAKKDISSYKLRKGDVIGLKITLRGKRMYQFLDKLVKIVFPRIRDFRGLPLCSFDSYGNYSIGFREQIVFPEIEYSKIDKIRGLQVTLVTSAQDGEKTKKLLGILGLPFEKK